jgi:hypothetical protein
LCLSRGLVYKRCKISRLMHKGEKQHPIMADAVDETVAHNRELAYARIIEFWYAPTSLRKRTERRGYALRPHGESGSVARRVPCEVFDRVDEARDSRFGPRYFVSHFASRCCTSA